MSNLDVPRPGDEWEDGVCVASGWIDDTHMAVMYIHDYPGSYYVIAQYNMNPWFNGWEWSWIYENYDNIVPAARAFHDTYEFWGGN